MTEYTKKVIFGSSIVLIFTALAALFGYLLRLVIARNLSQVEYGLIYSIMAIFGIFSILQNMGLSEALVKHIAEFKVHRENRKIKSAIIFTLIFQLSTAFILSAIFWVLAPFLAENYFKSSLAIWGIRLTAVFVFLAPIENVFLSIFQGYQKPVWYSLVNFAKMLFILTATFILFHFNKTIFSPIIAYILACSLPFLVYLPFFLLKIFPSFFSTKVVQFKQIAKKLFIFGIPVIFTIVSGTVITSIDTIMITFFKTLKDVAIYNAAIPTAGLLWFFGGSMAVILLPMSSEILKRKHSHLLGEGIPLLYKYGMIMITPLTALMIVFPEFILRILFRAEYSAGSNVLRILSITALFFTIGQINISILSGIGKPKINTKIVATAAIFNIIGNFFLIPTIGISGAAISTMISFVIIGILGTIALKKEIKFKLPITSWIKTIIVGCAFLLSLLILKNVLSVGMIPKIILSLAISLMVYVLLILATKTVKIEEIRMINARLGFSIKRSG